MGQADREGVDLAAMHCGRVFGDAMWATPARPSTFRRMETLAAARYGLRDIDGMNQADSEDPAVRASMTHALSLLDRFGHVKHDVGTGQLRSPTCSIFSICRF